MDSSNSSNCSNVTGNDDFDFIWGQIAYSVISLVGGSVGLLGNGVLFATVAASPQLRSKSSAILAMLAVSDFGLSLSGLAACAVNGQQALGQPLAVSLCAWGQMGTRLRYACTASSVLLTLALSIDRFAMVRYPVKYNSMPDGRYIKCWGVLATVTASVTGIFVGLHAQSQAKGMVERGCNAMCTEGYVMTSDFMTTINSTYFMNVFLAVLIVNLVSLKDVAALLETNSNDQFQSKAHVEMRVRRQRYRKSVQLVSVVYVLSWGFTVTTTAVKLALNAIREDSHTAIFIGSLQNIAANVNISSNFVIYWRRNAEYRTAVKRLLEKKKSQVAPGPSPKETLTPKPSKKDGSQSKSDRKAESKANRTIDSRSKQKLDPKKVSNERGLVALY